VQKNRKSLQ